VNIKTSRLDEMIKWYGFVVGTQVQFRYETGAWTTNDGANHRIAFLAVPGLSDDADKVRHNGMHHCAFEYGSFAELMSTYDRLRQSGVEPVFSLDHGMTMSLYYKDPDGNFVELQSDNFSDWKLSAEYMRESPQFAANPIGVFFDPARVYETLSPGPISRRWKRQSMPALSCPIPPQISVCRDKGCYVRFGSKADMCSATRDVRFTPNSDIDCVGPIMALPINYCVRSRGGAKRVGSMGGTPVAV
jgi:catechol 2,3-dioxygenase-like lactoylglutathione lyase family enzyme